MFWPKKLPVDQMGPRGVRAQRSVAVSGKQGGQSKKKSTPKLICLKCGPQPFLQTANNLDLDPK